MVFLHIPKCAGTSIREWLVKYALATPDPEYIDQHNLTSAYNGPLPTFAVVRNPYDRHLSWYKFCLRRVKELGERSFSFQEFTDGLPKVKEMFTKRGLYWGQPQTDWFTDKKPTYTLKYENLEQDFIIVQHKHSCYKPLLRLNISEEHSAKYNERIAEQVYNLYKPDFEMFEYNGNSYGDY